MKVNLLHDGVKPFPTPCVDQVKRISTFDAQYLQKGDVLMVRSIGVSSLGDHIIVVTGPVVKKPWGLRPETETFPVDDNASKLLDSFNPYQGAVLLKFNEATKTAFFVHNYIKVTPDGNVLIEEPTSVVY